MFHDALHHPSSMFSPKSPDLALLQKFISIHAIAQSKYLISPRLSPDIVTLRFLTDLTTKLYDQNTERVYLTRLNLKTKYMKIATKCESPSSNFPYECRIFCAPGARLAKDLALPVCLPGATGGQAPTTLSALSNLP